MKKNLKKTQPLNFFENCKIIDTESIKGGEDFVIVEDLTIG